MAAGSVAEAFVTIRPDVDQFGGMLRGKLGGLTKVAGVAAVGIGAAITGAAVAGVRAFAGLEESMNEVFTLLPGISEEAMGEMQDDVRDFSKEMGTATDEVVPALYQALSAGVPRDNVFEFLEVANKAAIGGVTSLETAVDGITSVVNSYGEEIIDAAKASDLMFTAVRLGKTNFEELSQSLFNVLPTAAGLGVAFEDVSAAMATMTSEGVPTSVATTQLRQLFVELSKAGGEAAEMFQEMAGQTFQEFIAEGGNTAEALDLMRQAAEESGVSLQDMFGSVEAGAAALVLAGGDTEKFREFLEEMQNSAGATETAFLSMDTGLGRAWERIKVHLDDLLVELGERIAPALQRFADWFGENLPGIIAWFERMGDAISVWWQTEAKPAIDEFVAAVKENWPKVKEIFESLGEVVGSVGLIFSTEFGSMTEDTDEATGSITENVTGVIDSMNALASTVATVTGIVASWWNVLSGAVRMDAGRMSRGIDSLTDGALFRFEEKVDEVVTNVIEWFRELPGKIRSAVGDLGGLLKGAGRDILEGLIGGIREKFEEVRSTLSDLTSRLPGWKGPESVDRKLFREPAFNIMEGLADDLLRGAGLFVRPALADITGNIAIGIPQQGQPGAGTVTAVLAAEDRDLLRAVADRPVSLQVDSVEIARANQSGEHKLGRAR